MPTLEFTRNEYPTIGVELELQLVDAETFALSNSIDDVLKETPEAFSEKIKPELMQSYLEINTDVCKTVRQAGEDLSGKLEELEKITGKLGLKLFWAATHPFSSWRDQKITVNDRYYRLVELMQDVARRLVTFGLHVHVGVDSGDKAVMICDRMLRHLPLLLALSSNSPFWEGRNTGLHSNRSKIMEGLPTAGLPYRMRNFSEYIWLVNHLIDTGFINTIREIWWDIRPHHHFGTVEIRVCDMPPNLEHVLALTALVQCLVQALSNEIDEGTFQSEYHPMMVQQNKWRATRYGADARLVDSEDYKQYSVQETTDRLIEILSPKAEELDCLAELQSVSKLPSVTGAKQQLEIFQKTNSRREVVKQMLEQNSWQTG
ncbi:MAG: YbdK family carboxylate-amine ligase [Planctomycetes bacterium]|nr:YbdK family carboxylate-amine ligase [Planctomycetota bacterium]